MYKIIFIIVILFSLSCSTERKVNRIHVGKIMNSKDKYIAFYLFDNEKNLKKDQKDGSLSIIDKTLIKNGFEKNILDKKIVKNEKNIALSLKSKKVKLNNILIIKSYIKKVSKENYLIEMELFNSDGEELVYLRDESDHVVNSNERLIKVMIRFLNKIKSLKKVD